MTEKLAAQFDRLMTDTPFIKDLDDLEQYLQLAIKLEHFTLPLYLTAYWSLRTDPNKPDPNLDLIATIFRTIAFEEMLHMGLVSNMVVAIGRRPKINTPEMIPQYPADMPGVKSSKPFALNPFSEDQLDRFMEIEFPETPPLPPTEVERALPTVQFKTIGAFYDAIDDALVRLTADLTYTTQGQLRRAFVDGVADDKLTVISNLAEARRAVALIKEQGEGASPAPGKPASEGASGFGNELAHYYQFNQIKIGTRYFLQDGKWVIDRNDPSRKLEIPGPDKIFAMATVPEKGYPGVTDEFNKHYTNMLIQLQAAWDATDPVTGRVALQAAVREMGFLGGIAKTLMATKIGDGPLCYGPDFRYLPPSVSAPPTPVAGPVTPAPTTVEPPPAAPPPTDA